MLSAPGRPSAFAHRADRESIYSVRPKTGNDRKRGTHECCDNHRRGRCADDDRGGNPVAAVAAGRRSRLRESQLGGRASLVPGIDRAAVASFARRGHAAARARHSPRWASDIVAARIVLSFFAVAGRMLRYFWGDTTI